MKRRILITMLILAVALTVLSACTRAESMRIKNPPEKTEYTVGDTELVLDGGELEVSYSNGETKNVFMNDKRVKAEGFNTAQAGEIEITLKFLKLTAKFTVTVVAPEKELIAVEIEALPAKLTYTAGIGVLDLTGGTLKLVYSDETTESISMKADGVTDSYSFAEAGISEVTLSYMGFSVSFNVTVTEPQAICLEIIQVPFRTSYYIGGTIDLTGGLVRIEYEDGTFVDYPMNYEDLHIEYNFSSAGESTVDVSYFGLSDSFTVNIISNETRWSHLESLFSWAAYFFQDWRDTPFMHCYLSILEMERDIYESGDSATIDHYDQYYASTTFEIDLTFYEYIYFEGLLADEALPFVKALSRLAYIYDTYSSPYGTYTPTEEEINELTSLYDNLSNYYRTIILFGLISDPNYYGEMYTAYWYYAQLTSKYFSTFMSSDETNCYYNLIQADILYSAYLEFGEVEDLYRFCRYFDYVINYYAGIVDTTLWDSYFGELYNYYKDIYDSIEKIPQEILAMMHLIENELNDALYYLMNFNEFGYYLTYLLDYFDMAEAALNDPNLAPWVTNISFYNYEGNPVTLEEIYWIYADDFQYALDNDFYDYWGSHDFADFYVSDVLPVIRKWIHAKGGLNFFHPETFNRELYPEFDNDMEAMWQAIYAELGDYKYSLTKLIFENNYNALSQMSRDHYKYVLSAQEYAVYDALFSASSTFFAYMSYAIEPYFDDFLEKMGKVMAQYNALESTALFDTHACKTAYDYWAAFHNEYVLPEPEDYDSTYLLNLFNGMNKWSPSRQTIWLYYYYEALKEKDYIYSQGRPDWEHYFEVTFGWRFKAAEEFYRSYFPDMIQMMERDETGDYFEFVYLSSKLLKLWTENGSGVIYPDNNNAASRLLELYYGLAPVQIGAYVINLSRNDFFYFYLSMSRYYTQWISSTIAENVWWVLAEAYSSLCVWRYSGATAYFSEFITNMEKVVTSYNNLSQANKDTFNSLTNNFYPNMHTNYVEFNVQPPEGYDWSQLADYFDAMEYAKNYNDIIFLFGFFSVSDEVKLINESGNQQWISYLEKMYSLAYAEAQNYYSTRYAANAPDLFEDGEGVAFVKYFIIQYVSGDFDNLYGHIIVELNRLFAELNGYHKEQLLSGIISDFVYWYCMVQTTYYITDQGFSIDEVNVYWSLILADLNYYAWLATGKQERLSDFNEVMQLAIERYESLQSKTRFNSYFKDLYDFWVDTYYSVVPAYAVIIGKRFSL